MSTTVTRPLKVPRSWRFLQHVASFMTPAHACVIGIERGYQITAIARAIRYRSRLPVPERVGRVVVYHWRRGLLTASNYIKALDREWYASRKAVMSSEQRMLSDIVRFVDGGGTRGPWRDDVARLLEAGAPPFGFICHIGKGRPWDIHRDLAILTPMLTDTTRVCLCGMDREGSQSEFARMLAAGWHGVTIGAEAFLQMPTGLAKERSHGSAP